MAKNNDIKILSVRLEKAYASNVEKVVESVDCSVSEFIKNAIDFYLMNHRVTEVVVKKQQLVRRSA